MNDETSKPPDDRWDEEVAEALKNRGVVIEVGQGLVILATYCEACQKVVRIDGNERFVEHPLKNNKHHPCPDSGLRAILDHVDESILAQASGARFEGNRRRH